MDFLQVFERVMENSATFALATSQNDAPNVRIITFYYEAANKGIVYFPTFRTSPKTLEFSRNDKVAFTTIPNGPEGVVRVANATVRKSEKTVEDIKDGITKKYPGFGAMAANVGPMLDIYEVHFNEATVTADNNNIGKVAL